MFSNAKEDYKKTQKRKSRTCSETGPLIDHFQIERYFGNVDQYDLFFEFFICEIDVI